MTPWLGPYWVKKGRYSAGAKPTYAIVTKSGFVVVANFVSKRVADQTCETMNRVGATPDRRVS